GRGGAAGGGPLGRARGALGRGRRCSRFRPARRLAGGMRRGGRQAGGARRLRLASGCLGGPDGRRDRLWRGRLGARQRIGSASAATVVMAWWRAETALCYAPATRRGPVV